MLWPTAKLSEICIFDRGLTYTKSDEVNFDGTPVLRANNIDLAKNLLDLSDIRYISSNVVVPNSKRTKQGALLICTASGSKAHLGKVAYIDDAIGWAFGGFMGQITAKPSVDSRYLYYILISEAFRTHLEKRSDGVNINNLKFSDIEDFAVPLPPLTEQQRIVAILDEAFAGIAKATANTEQNIANAEKLFASSLQQAMQDVAIGANEMTLESAAREFGRGRSRHRPRNDPTLYGGPYPFIQTGDVRRADHVITAFDQTYNELGLAQSKLWPAGTVCITIAANIAETGILTFPACFPDSVIGFTPDPNLADADYVEFLLQSYRLRLQAEGKGSAQANINLGTFEAATFPFPSLSTQRATAAKLLELKDRVVSIRQHYQREIDSLSELRASLLHRAFTGQLTNASAVAA